MKWSPMSSNGKGREALLQLDDVGLVYQGSHGPQRVLQHISLSLDEGQHLTVVGPSGCGKSSLLRLIAGLQAPTEGQICFAGQKMTGPRPTGHRLPGLWALPLEDRRRKHPLAGTAPPPFPEQGPVRKTLAIAGPDGRPQTLPRRTFRRSETADRPGPGYGHAAQAAAHGRTFLGPGSGYAPSML